MNPSANGSRSLSANGSDNRGAATAVAAHRSAITSLALYEAARVANVEVVGAYDDALVALEGRRPKLGETCPRAATATGPSAFRELLDALLVLETHCHASDCWRFCYW